MSWPFHPDLLAVPVPRYTSYPTAAEFGDGVGAGDLDRALAGVLPEQPLSLYLHIPYCREICWYCGCNTGAATRSARVQAYVHRLGQEIDALAARLAGRGRVGRIAWGGGSPNALAPEDFRALQARVRLAFGAANAVTSIELDPRAFDDRWAELVAETGIERVSLGVQTFAPHVQQAIGRIQPAAMIERGVAALRAAGVGSINFDLMYGLPHQTPGDLAETLTEALSLRPDRLAVFGYAHVPSLLPRQRVIDAAHLPGVEARFRLAEYAHAALSRAGYAPVGFDHFALPADALAVAARTGSLRRNFQGYTDDAAEVLLGLGASAISAFPGALLQNEKNAGRYQMRIAATGAATARGLIRSADDRLRGRLIERLLCGMSADLALLPDRDEIFAAVDPFLALGLAIRHGSALAISAPGLPYARAVAATLDPYRRLSSRRFSSAI